MSVCSNIISQLQNIHSLRDQLSQEIDALSINTNRELKVTQLMQIFTTRRKIKIDIAEIRSEMNPKISTSNFIKQFKEGPVRETKIDLDFNAIVSKTRLFYETDGIYIDDEFEEKAKEIWLRNFDAIKNEVATYGYDRVLIIPAELPKIRVLDAKMTEGYSKTYKQANFIDKGSFDKVKNSISRDNVFHILLTHDAQFWENHPLLEATKNKNMLYFAGNSLVKFNNIIVSGNDLILSLPKKEVSFGPDKRVANDTIIAEGFTLAEYLIFQRQFFLETGRHLDKDKRTWLPATSLSYQHIATATYQSASYRISLDAERITSHGNDLGCRLCRVFT